MTNVQHLSKASPNSPISNAKPKPLWPIPLSPKKTAPERPKISVFILEELVISMTNAVIAGYARSPFAPAKKGGLTRVRPDEMAAEVVRALIARTGVKPEDIEDIIVGCAFPEAEQGLNVARLIALLADLPISVAGATVNRFCGSSMYSVHMAAGAIAMGAGEAFLAVGVESMTRVPMGGYNPMPSPMLYAKNPAAYMGMGDTAENVAQRWQITRDAQEEFALASHVKAAAAQKAGRLSAEIAPLTQSKAKATQD
jgi:acetyl-CoA acyltransferase